MKEKKQSELAVLLGYSCMVVFIAEKENDHNLFLSKDQASRLVFVEIHNKKEGSSDIQLGFTSVQRFTQRRL